MERSVARRRQTARAAARRRASPSQKCRLASPASRRSQRRAHEALAPAVRYFAAFPDDAAAPGLACALSLSACSENT